METRPFQVRLIYSFCSSDRGFASDFLQTPPHDGRPCLWLTVPTAKPVADFHRQVITHAERTRKTDNPDLELSVIKAKQTMTSYGGIIRIRLKGRSLITSSQPAIQAPLHNLNIHFFMIILFIFSNCNTKSEFPSKITEISSGFF